MTTAFLTAWRDRTSRAPATLAKITFSSPSATLRVATRQVALSDGTLWEAGLTAEPLTARVESLGTGPNPADCTIHLADRLYPLGTGPASSTLKTYKWQGANVVLYLWNDVRKLDGSQVLAAADLAQVLEGTVDGFDIDDDGLTLNLLQARSWNKPTPPTMIDSNTYPNAPDVSQSQPAPLIYGDHRALPLRSPHTSSYGTTKQRQEESGGGAGVVPMVLVDPGTGAANVKLLAAAHKCITLLDRANGYSQFIRAGDVIAPLDVAGLTVTLNAGESFVTVADDSMVAYYGLRPVDVRSSTTGSNPRRALDVLDETSFATLDQGAGKTILEYALPSGAGLGNISAVDVICCFVGNAGNANNLRVYPRNPGTGVTGTAVSFVATGTTPAVATGAWDAAWWTQNWDFAGISGSAAPDRTAINVKIDFAGGAANKASILWIALRVKYKPNRSTTTPGAPGHILIINPINPDKSPSVRWQFGVAPTFSVDDSFYANLQGQPDDGSGTITGTANALIELAPDVVRHFLATYGLQTQFETTFDPWDASVGFGSFIRARYTGGRAYGAFPKLACWIGGSVTSVQQVVQHMCEQAAGCVIFDRFASKWLYHLWNSGAAANYDWTFTRQDVPDLFQAGVTSDVDLKQGLRIRYGYDHFRGKTLFEAFVTAIGSSQGFSQVLVRDQQVITIAAGNKYIDVDLSGTPYAATLALATYSTPISLAQAAKAALDAVLPAGERLIVGYGFECVAGYNDSLTIAINGITDTITIPAGIYAPDELAVVVTGQIAAKATLTTKATCRWSWQYSQFQFVADAGNVSVGFTAPGDVVTAAWTLLGWDAAWVQAARGGFFGPDPSTGPTIYAPSSRYQNRYYLSVLKGISCAYKWSTGANAANNCALELGFDKTDLIANSGDKMAQHWRAMREKIAKDSQDLYGPKQDQPLVADWVRDEGTSVVVRDAIFDFGSVPRAWVKFRTYSAPDMQRMRVIAFDASVDGRRVFPAFGSDGSWAGKTFRVLEVVQDLGPSYHTEIYAEQA